MLASVFLAVLITAILVDGLTGTVCLVLPMFHNLLLGVIFFCLNLLDRCMESEYL